MSLFGLSPDDFAGKEIEVWPDNERAVSLFARMSTQWRIAMGRPTGLDYGVIPILFDRWSVTPDEYMALIDDLRVLEQAALECIHES